MAANCHHEMDSMSSVVMSCLLVLPPFQRHGYGRFLVDLSKHAVRLYIMIHSSVFATQLWLQLTY